MSTKIQLATVLLLLCLNVSNKTVAQSTGSYDTTITFMGSPRAVSMHVPTTYSASTAYKLMICLHGLGDTCYNYRTSLVASLAWGVNMPNTIFVCPEAANRNGDFYYPAGGDAIIQASIDFARATYNIDTTDIVLQGFSLGGRAALRYGLDNYNRFKGLLLNTPAVQGVKEAINGGAYNFTYANASNIPIYITHGADDILYTAPIDSAYEQLVLNDGIVRYFDFPGVGHSIPPIAGIINFVSFFDTPAHAGFDLDVVSTTIAQRSCVPTLPATCLVRNTGESTIHTISLDYTVAGSTLSHTWTGTLAPFQHAVISLPTISSPIGNQTLNVKVASLETSVTDTVLFNNEQTVPFQIVGSGMPLPLNEGFEGTFPPANWVQYKAGDVYSAWDIDNTVKKTGTGSMASFNTILIFDNAGRKDEMASPLLDLTSVPSPHMTFDVAYNYNHYTPPVTTIDTVFADTLLVQISTDCGDTYATVYKKGGAELATFSSPILNPLSIAASFISPAASNWRTEDINLAAYATNDKVIAKITYISALGGSINIDNVSFNNGGLAVEAISREDIRVFPNPASNYVNISGGGAQIDEVTIQDITGKMVWTNGRVKSHNITVDLEGLANGVYTARVVSNGGVTVSKIVVSR
jgi:pimeloyl-ACP methyl ester carboxylesterase